MQISLRGRYLVVAWIAVFLVVAGIVTLRDRAAFRVQKSMALVEESLQVVERQHNELNAEIANCKSSGALTPIGERLGLRIPSDTEIETVRVTEP